MGKVKTGALIVVEKTIQCREYERTGIPIDAEISSQLLVNIFEHNTPLHDGAVLIRDNRIVAATCYLPLSNNLQVSKELGTRTGRTCISEVSDSQHHCFRRDRTGRHWPAMANCTAGSMQIR